MKKCVCTACGFNFATRTMADEHRVGGFSGKDIEKFGERRCLTEQEMLTMGWILNRQMPVDTILDGHNVQIPMDTWTEPGQLEKRAARAKLVHGSKDSDEEDESDEQFEDAMEELESDIEESGQPVDEEDIVYIFE